MLKFISLSHHFTTSPQVIHYGAAMDVESYYQEVGRAGRDNLPSICVALIADKDWAVNRYKLLQVICNFFFFRDYYFFF